MAYDVGDWTVPTLAVDPSDGTTAAALVVVAPDGTASTPSTSSPDGGATWSAAGYELTAPGEWVERWTVTGTGKSKERRTLLVAPDPATTATGARVYATTADLATYLHAAPPAGSRRALVAASRMVEAMTRAAVYTVDDDGLPTDAAVLMALRDATCAQATYARAQGDAYSVGAAQYAQMSIGSVTLTRAQGAAGSAASGPYSPDAWRILSAAGLTAAGPWVWT